MASYLPTGGEDTKRNLKHVKVTVPDLTWQVAGADELAAVRFANPGTTPMRQFTRTRHIGQNDGASEQHKSAEHAW